MTDIHKTTNNVFINCPFDKDFYGILDVLVFTIFDCGFVPRCALEIDDSSIIRIHKILNIIESCRYAIHDLSRTDLDKDHGLPRFNMPLELGIFIGAKRFGGRIHREKSYIILDIEDYRYQKFISDIAGQDIRGHNNDPRVVVDHVRNWLNSASGRRTIPGGARIWQRYQAYKSDLPAVCAEAGLHEDEMTFNDKANFASEWLKLESASGE